MNKTSLARDDRGASLIELMVVLAVMGILVAIAIPSVGLQVANAELNRGARDVVSVLRRARAEAVNEQIPRSVTLPTTTPARLQVYRCSPTANFMNCSWQAQGAAIRLPDSVRLAVPSTDFPQLTDTPVPGQNVPKGSVYFSTTGGYPYAPLTSGVVYTITVSSTRKSGSRTIRVARNTGHTTISGF